MVSGQCEGGGCGSKEGTYEEEGGGEEGVEEDEEVERAADAEEPCDERHNHAVCGQVSLLGAQRVCGERRRGAYPTNLYPSYARTSSTWLESPPCMRRHK